MSASTRPRLLRSDLQPGECLCDHCTAKCCKYFALNIETPKTRDDFDMVRWFLLHDRATVFTEDGAWYLLIHTHCKHLQPDNRCGIYDTRPQVCRDYSTDNCEFEDDAVYDTYFETPEQIAEYIEARFPPSAGESIRSPRPALLPILN